MHAGGVLPSNELKQPLFKSFFSFFPTSVCGVLAFSPASVPLPPPPSPPSSPVSLTSFYWHRACCYWDFHPRACSRQTHTSPGCAAIWIAPTRTCLGVMSRRVVSRYVMSCLVAKGGHNTLTQLPHFHTTHAHADALTQLIFIPFAFAQLTLTPLTLISLRSSVYQP